MFFPQSTQEMQSLAERSVKKGVRQIEYRRRPGIQAALVALYVTTGQIRAMVGGADFDKSQFNRSTMALRQPGAAFKPFAYAAALRNGMSCNDRILNEPVGIRDPDSAVHGPRGTQEENTTAMYPLRLLRCPLMLQR
jgi:membrane carboxypeptidase/penicillin-binding protein